MKEIDYSKFPSLVRTASEIKLGMIIYHVYGHISREPSKEEVLEAPKRVEYDFLCFRTRSNYGDRKRFCGDVGIGADHNQNRIFTDEQDAKAFIEACREAGINNTLPA